MFIESKASGTGDSASFNLKHLTSNSRTMKSKNEKKNQPWNQKTFCTYVTGSNDHRHRILWQDFQLWPVDDNTYRNLCRDSLSHCLKCDSKLIRSSADRCGVKN